MAIIEKDTGHYYKVNFDECSIRGTKVYVNYTTYKSEGERNKEKIRQDAMASFFYRLRQVVDNTEKELLEEVNKLGVKPENIISKEDNYKIDKDKYPVLRAKQELCGELASYENKLFQDFYKYGDKHNVLSINKNTKALLMDIGYSKEWKDSPVCIMNSAEIYVGEYNGEIINQEFYYNRLKTVMNDSLEDC